MDSKILRKILTNKEFPYLLTILFVLVGWSFTHVVNRLLQSPTLEYKIRESREKANSLSYEIENITRDKLFKDLTFLLLFDGPAKEKLIKADLVVLPPARISGEVKLPPVVEAEYAKFFVPEFHPNWRMALKVELKVGLSEKEYPRLRFSTGDDKPIRLVPASFETFLVKHEFSIILILLVSWSLLIISYLYCLGKANIPVEKAKAENGAAALSDITDKNETRRADDG